MVETLVIGQRNVELGREQLPSETCRSGMALVPGAAAFDKMCRRCQPATRERAVGTHRSIHFLPSSSLLLVMGPTAGPN